MSWQIYGVIINHRHLDPVVQLAEGHWDVSSQRISLDNLMPYDQSLSKVRMVLKGTCLDFWTWYNGMTSFNF